MAERQSMTTREVVAKTLLDEHADFLGGDVRPLRLVLGPAAS